MGLDDYFVSAVQAGLNLVFSNMDLVIIFFI